MATHERPEPIELRTNNIREQNQARSATPNASRRRTSSAISPITTTPITTEHNSATSNLTTPTPPTPSLSSGLALFNQYHAQPLTRVLKPFFFASIGFSIPISKLFSGPVVWKGMIFTILMIIGKLACGIWLLRLPKQRFLKTGRNFKTTASKSTSQQHSQQSDTPAATSSVNDTHAITETAETLRDSADSTPQGSPQAGASSPLSLYPSLILGCAMTARGEIGFLVSAIASSNGIFGSDPSSEIFLVVTWAIVLCTIAGPISVGLLVRRVRRLESEAKRGRGGRNKDVLGVWGVG